MRINPLRDRKVEKMKDEEFYKKYANTPIGDRFIRLNFIEYGNMTLADLYQEFEKLGNEIRPLKLKQQALKEIAENFWKRKLT